MSEQDQETNHAHTYTDEFYSPDELHWVENWDRVKASMRREVGESTYRSWVKPIEYADNNGLRVRLSVPSRFVRDWVQANYLDALRRLWMVVDDNVQDVEVIVRAAQNSPYRPIDRRPLIGDGSTPPEVGTELPSPSIVPTAHSGRYAVPTDSRSLVSRFTFEKFVVGSSNELAYAAARRVAESEEASFNPLFLYGGVGLGKTHLMHAIAWHIRQTRPERKVAYLSAERFMSLFIQAVRHKDTQAFKDEFRSVDVLMIDDIHFIGGKEASQEEFFHTFNALVDQGHQIVISADKSPSDLEGLEERLRSRLGWGLVADVHPTTLELRIGILTAKAESLNCEIPERVIEFLAHKITGNVRELEGAINRIEAHSSLIKRPVTVELVQDILHDVLRAHDRRVTIEEIQRKVSDHFNIKLSEMFSPRRARSVARPRQIAMYLCKQLTSRSLPEIGRKFGNRDHTTVMHAVRKVDELKTIDSSFADDVELLRRALES